MWDHAIRVAFPREALTRLALRSESAEVRWHMEILKERRLPTLGRDKRYNHQRKLADKRSWEMYLRAAQASGLLTADRDLIARLHELQGPNFRSALAECISCWFLREQLGFPVKPRPPGRPGTVLDLESAVGGVRVGIEVKSSSSTPKGLVWGDDDSGLIEADVADANKQFDESGPNILFLVPHLLIPLHSNRRPLVVALIGRQTINWEVDLATGSAVTEPHSGFVFDGKFTRPIKFGHQPANTRISAVVAIERETNWGNLGFLDKNYLSRATVVHHVLILHNPHAKFPLDPSHFIAWPQLIRDGEYLRWTKGR